VIGGMRALAVIAEDHGIVPGHEKGIYGDRRERCADLIEAAGSPALRATFDPASFVQCGVRPHDDGYALLRPCLVYLQVKDAVAATGEVVPARATADCARRWPLCGTWASRTTCRSTAPGAGRAARRIQRAGGLSPRRRSPEGAPERPVGPVAMNRRPGRKHGTGPSSVTVPDPATWRRPDQS
jgi:hypothetical protein